MRADAPTTSRPRRAGGRGAASLGLSSDLRRRTSSSEGLGGDSCTRAGTKAPATTEKLLSVEQLTGQPVQQGTWVVAEHPDQGGQGSPPEAEEDRTPAPRAAGPVRDHSMAWQMRTKPHDAQNTAPDATPKRETKLQPKSVLQQQHNKQRKDCAFFI